MTPDCKILKPEKVLLMILTPGQYDMRNIFLNLFLW